MTEGVSRRDVLASVAAGPVAALAGCQDLLGADPDRVGRDETGTPVVSEAPGSNEEREELLARIEDLESEVGRCHSRLATLRGLELEALGLDERPFVDDVVHERVAETVRPLRTSVVKLLMDDPHYAEGEAPPATGWVYDDGLVATNKHVADPGDLGDWEVAGVETLDGDVRDCEVLASEREIDAALLEVSTEGLDPLPTGGTEDLEMDDPVVTLGHPSTVGQWVMTLGAYRGERAGRAFVVEGASARGNSGSPMIDDEGDVVGMLGSGGAIDIFSEDVPAEFERSDFLFDESPSCSSAAFERYPQRTYVMGVEAEILVDRFEAMRGE